MAAPELDFIKSWCRIDGSEFDTQLPTMIDGATKMAGNITGVDYTVVEMPTSVKQWVAAQISYWINNPDAATERSQSVSPMFDRLLDPYLDYSK